MSRISAYTQTACFSLLLLAMALPSQAADDATTPSAGVSKIRIVRLSEVKGAVQMDRNTDRGFEPAMANMPIVEKATLRTDQGVAEVEFEDNSTLRLAPNSEVEFPRLERLASGATASSVRVLKGTVYASMVKSKGGNDFSLLFGSQKVAIPSSTHIRLQVGDKEARLAVLDGTMQIDGPSGAQDVPKKKTVTFQLQDQNQPEIAKNVSSEPFDSWDKESADYHARSASYSALSNSPYAYGLNDMTYYGSFADMGGCGMMWRPYFASATWDPFANGAWAWYPGAGYSWVSPYPWGWTPYHYGTWSFCAGSGWGWLPGGAWNGLNNIATLTPRNPVTGGGTGTIPAPPKHPPLRGDPTISTVNLKPIVRSGLASTDSFEFRKDSAGLGIPRDSLGKLDKLSRQTVEKGTARTSVYLTAPSASAGGPVRATNTVAAPPTMHRGSAPPSAFSAESPTRMPAPSGGYSGGTSGSPSSPRSSGPSAPSGQSPSSASSSHPR
jgi:hypothetical protein